MYNHTQKSVLMAFASMAMLAGAAAAWHVTGRQVIIYPVAAVALVIYFSFRELTVEVDQEAVSISFGIGWFKKRFPFADISSVRAVRNSWLCGWGIHFIGRGWVYNVSGFDAVELTFRNGRIARIGTDEPQMLETAIKERLSLRK